jgi:outer membrane protein assembly factor BamB
VSAWTIWAAFAWCLAAQAQAPAPPEAEILSRVGLAGESPRTARRIVAAEKLVAEHTWSEAIDELTRIIREAGDDLIPLDVRHLVHARRLCHLRLAALPAEGLSIYRSRVDKQAKMWLDEGRATRNPDLLRRVVDETFASSVTDQALDTLGDLDFESGRFDEAERWWMMLAAPVPKGNGPGVKDRLVFPDPQVDVARVQAKQLLARLFRGDHTTWLDELKAFEKRHADAKGRLAGEEGRYVEVLARLAGRFELVKAPLSEESWPTFAGSPTRSFILPAAPDGLARLPQLQGPKWTIRLDAGRRIPRFDWRAGLAAKIPSPFTTSRSLAFFPIVAGSRVVVSDARYVKAFDLKNGRRIWQYDLAADGKTGELSLRLPAEAELSYTLTATSDRVFARLGVQGLTSHREKGDDTNPDSFLVCLNLFPPRAGPVKKWVATPPSSPGSYAAFEGAPLVYQDNVYVAVTRFSGVDVQASVACYDGETRALRWQRDVSTTPEPRDRAPRYQHHLLTLAGRDIVYCSHSGAITALDASTGRHTWSIRYPTRETRTESGGPSPRSLAPCLYSDGRIYVAPFDFDRILCLDRDTGHIVWESQPVEVVHLLGVARGRLIFTAISPRSFTPQHSIRALDTVTGQALRTWYQPADGSGELATFGRGLLAGGWVYWPTSAGLYVLNQEDSEPILFDPNIRGNLAAANGCLVVAGTEFMSAYLPEDLMSP